LLLAVIILDLPIQLGIHLGYRADVAAVGANAGYDISITTVCLVALYILWLTGYLIGVRPQPRPLLRSSLPFAAYLGIVALSALWAQDSTLSLFEMVLLIQMFLLYIYVASSVRTRDDVTFIVVVLLIGLVLESLIMVAPQVLKLDLHLPSLRLNSALNKVPTDWAFRSVGTFGSPNAAGSYLSMLLAPAISVLLTPLRARYKWLAATAFGLGAAALLLTFSRGGWIALGVSCIIFFVAAWRRGWISLGMMAVAAAPVMSSALIFQGEIQSRLSQGDNSRVTLIKIASFIIRDHPVFGVGANNYAVAMRQYLTPEFSNAWLYLVHNTYLLIWAETGLGGLIAFLSFLFVTIHRGRQCWKDHDRLLSSLALGFTAGLIGHMVHMQLDLFHERLPWQCLSVFAGLIMAMSRMHDAHPAQQSRRATEPVRCDQ